jgi:hypothetical protein
MEQRHVRHMGWILLITAANGDQCLAPPPRLLYLGDKPPSIHYSESW